MAKDITWVFTIVVKTDSTTGQPSQEDMREMLGHMEVQLEFLTAEYGFDYTVEKAELRSDEHLTLIPNEE